MRSLARRNATAHASDLPPRPRRKNGTVSSTVQVPRELAPVSNIIGAMDRATRTPYCRLTAYNINKPEGFRAILPMAQAVDRTFQRYVPDRYAAQHAMIERTHAEWRVSDTAFTTITVNKNFATAVHKDAGDLPEGFSCLSIIRSGAYQGGLLVLPQYRIAFDLQTTDVLLMDAHEWHGNTPILGKEGAYARVACVFYYRTNMVRCGTVEEELQRAKGRHAGQPIYDGAD